jgi:acyl-CoA thioesterase-2
VLQTVLELEQIDGDRFAAPAGGWGRERTFGGQVAAQALRAGSLTVTSPRLIHSLHCYFIRPGRPAEPVEFEVARTRDGRSFSTRHITAVQEGKPIFEMIASFCDPAPGEDWPPPAAPAVPPPHELQPVQFPWLFGDDQPVDIRPVATAAPGAFPISHPCWMRVTADIGTDPAKYACVVTFLSDIAVVRAARAPRSAARHDRGISLDHSIWFHRPPQAGHWFLYSMDPVAHVSTRGLARGAMHALDGTLIASVAQEVLIRPRG